MFFFQAEDGIRDSPVTGVQTCALPICPDEEGYWLDKGEEKHIRDYMKERKSRLSRSSSAEASFHDWRHGASSGIIQKIKNIFR